MVAEAAAGAGWEIRGFYDDDGGAVLASKGGRKHRGMIRDFESGLSKGDLVILAVGGIQARARILCDHGGVLRAGTVVAAGAWLAPSARLGAGVFVGVGAVVQSCATVADHAIINTSAVVEHECVIGRNTHVAPGAVLGGRVVVGENTLVGIGSRVLPSVRIGSGCTIGGGAVVTRDVADGMTVAGVPARPVIRR